MSTKSFIFPLPEGEFDPKYPTLESNTILRTIPEAVEYYKQTGHIETKTRLEEIMRNMKTKRMKKDGFEAGWQENIQEHVGGRREYDRRLRELGLVEIGYDYVPQESKGVEKSPCANLDFALAVKEQCPDIGDNQVDAIASGEFFSDGSSIE